MPAIQVGGCGGVARRENACARTHHFRARWRLSGAANGHGRLGAPQGISSERNARRACARLLPQRPRAILERRINATGAQKREREKRRGRIKRAKSGCGAERG